jgi:hypothetical protein
MLEKSLADSSRQAEEDQAAKPTFKLPDYLEVKHAKLPVTGVMPGLDGAIIFEDVSGMVLTELLNRLLSTSSETKHKMEW